MSIAGAAHIGRGLARGALLAAGLSSLAVAWAQPRPDFSLSVPFELEHDTNPTLAIGGGARGVTWLRANPTLTTQVVRGADEYRLEAGLTAEKSSDTSVAADRLDPRMRGVWKHLAPRDKTELSFQLDRSAFRDLDVREQVPVGVDGARTLFALAGNWAHELDARTAFSADLRQEWERYSNAIAPDFRRTLGAVRLTRQHDERSAWYAGLNAQDYRSDGMRQKPPAPPLDATRSRVAGAVLGFTHAFSEAWRVEANAGPMHFFDPAPKTDWQGMLKLDYTAARWTASVETTRSPGVNTTAGGLAVTQDLRGSLRYELDALSRLEVEAARNSESAGGGTRTLASVAWLREWSPTWRMVVKASTLRQDSTFGAAKSNRLSLMLVYSSKDL